MAGRTWTRRPVVATAGAMETGANERERQARKVPLRLALRMRYCVPPWCLTRRPRSLDGAFSVQIFSVSASERGEWIVTPPKLLP